jgi:hypothetical protein
MDADLKTKDGHVERVDLQAFPDNPGLVKFQGQWFVPDDPVIGYGTAVLSYHEVQPYEIGAPA